MGVQVRGEVQDRAALGSQSRNRKSASLGARFFCAWILRKSWRCPLESPATRPISVAAPIRRALSYPALALGWGDC